MKTYEYLEHTADIKFRAYGKTVEQVFSNSALAMFNSMSEEKIKESKKIKFRVKGSDLESLMYNFLEELLFYFETKNFFLNKIKIKINGFNLIAEASGGNSKDLVIDTHIKAVTYHEMFIKRQKNKCVAQVVLDV